MTKLETGVVHDVPADLKKALTSTEKVRALWNNLTPLARNEWICWVTHVKKEETRKEHVERVCEDLLRGNDDPAAGRDARTAGKARRNGLSEWKNIESTQ